MVPLPRIFALTFGLRLCLCSPPVLNETALPHSRGRDLDNLMLEITVGIVWIRYFACRGLWGLSCILSLRCNRSGYGLVSLWLDHCLSAGRYNLFAGETATEWKPTARSRLVRGLFRRSSSQLRLCL